MIYTDTSVLLSAYVTDGHSPHARRLLAATSEPLFLTGLVQLEFQNGLQLRVFRSDLSAAEAQRFLALLRADAAAQRLRTAALNWSGVWSDAVRLAAAHTRTLGTRSLDILHVACALQLQATAFYTFDKRQADLARGEGMAVAGA